MGERLGARSTSYGWGGSPLDPGRSPLTPTPPPTPPPTPTPNPTPDPDPDPYPYPEP